MIADTTTRFAEVQGEWIFRQAYDFYHESMSRVISPAARERARRKFVEYARQAITIYGAEAVAKASYSGDWQKLISALGGEMGSVEPPT